MSDDEIRRSGSPNGDIYNERDSAVGSPRQRSRSRSFSRSRSRSRSRSHSPSPRYRRKSYSRSRSRSRSRHRRRSYSRSFSRSRSHSFSPRRRRSYNKNFRSRSRSPLSNRKRHQGDRYNPKPSRVLGLFGLSLYTGEKDLKVLLNKYGQIERVQVVYDHQTGRSRGFAFVYFKEVDDAVDAKEHLNGTEVDGRRLRVDYSITKRPHTPTPGVYMGRPTRSGDDREKDRDRDRDRGDRYERNDRSDRSDRGYDRDRYSSDNYGSSRSSYGGGGGRGNYY